jgi:hypothetical protein
VKCWKRGTNVRAGRANNLLTTQWTILNNALGNEIVESLRCTRVWEHAWGRNHPPPTRNFCPECSSMDVDGWMWWKWYSCRCHLCKSNNSWSICTQSPSSFGHFVYWRVEVWPLYRWKSPRYSRLTCLLSKSWRRAHVHPRCKVRTTCIETFTPIGSTARGRARSAGRKGPHGRERSAHPAPAAGRSGVATSTGVEGPGRGGRGRSRDERLLGLQGWHASSRNRS